MLRVITVFTFIVNLEVSRWTGGVIHIIIILTRKQGIIELAG